MTAFFLIGTLTQSLSKNTLYIYERFITYTKQFGRNNPKAVSEIPENSGKEC